MALSMKEKNGEKTRAAYEKAAKKLAAAAVKKRNALETKYKKLPKPEYGIDNDPEMKEAGEITKWFSQELKKLKQQYGIR